MNDDRNEFQDRDAVKLERLELALKADTLGMLFITLVGFLLVATTPASCRCAEIP